MKSLRAVLSPLFAILGLLTVACSTTPDATAQSSATAKPGCLIQIEVQRPNEVAIKSSVEEGDSFRLENKANGQILAFKPVVEPKRAKIQVFSVKASNGKETLDFLDEAEVQVGAQELKQVAKVYSVRIVQVRDCPTS